MSEEEKEAIKKVKSYIEWVKDRGTDTDKDIEIILNYIDKLQKENEELKAINSMQKYRIEVIDERELISKEKLKTKIKELEETQERKKNKSIGIYNKIEILKELLGE